MNETLWRIIEAISAVALVPFIGFLTTLWIQKIKLQNQQIKGDTWEKTKLIVKIAVESAEQQYKAKLIIDRKIHAINVAKKLLVKEKIKIDDDLLSELIESTVWDTINSPAANGNTSVVGTG